jgi:hypothetical protein
MSEIETKHTQYTRYKLSPQSLAQIESTELFITFYHRDNDPPTVKEEEEEEE